MKIFIRLRLFSLTVATLALLAIPALPHKAWAQCEMSASASSALNNWLQQDKKNIKNFTKQEQDYIDKRFKTAIHDINNRLDEFQSNLLKFFNSWWQEQFLPALQGMTRQLSVAQVDQTRMYGSLIDARSINEGLTREAARQAEAHKRYTPSEISCQLDTVGPGQTKAFQMARALNRGLTLDDVPRRGNAEGSIASTGRSAELSSLWNEYRTYFCDNTKGDPGCTTPGLRAGQHKDLGALLWGNKLTVDLSQPENRVVMAAALRYLVYPFSSNTIPSTAVNTPNGHQAILARRAETARVNAVYNVVGQMLAERAGGNPGNAATGSGVNTQAMLTALGIPAGNASTNASYHEIRESMNRYRQLHPLYLLRMMGNPEAMSREQETLSALRLQTMYDLYRRQEELLFMAAAEYAHDLDKRPPGTSVRTAPVK